MVVRIKCLTAITRPVVVTRTATNVTRITRLLHLSGASQGIFNDHHIETTQGRTDDRRLDVNMLKRIKHDRLESVSTQVAKLLNIGDNIIQISIKTIQILNGIGDGLAPRCLAFSSFYSHS